MIAVIPAKAGIQLFAGQSMDSRFRGNDDQKRSRLAQLTGEGGLQQGLAEGGDVGELLGAKSFDPTGLVTHGIKSFDDLLLLVPIRIRNSQLRKCPLIQALDVCADSAIDHFSADRTRLDEMSDEFRRDFFVA